MNFIHRYLTWLQKDNPVGLVEKYPEIDNQFQSSRRNVYISGDLTGIPLLKFAADSGTRIVRQIVSDFESQKYSPQPDIHDVVIIGAGPSGVSAALECKAHGLKYTVIEAHQLFNTLANFPKGKPILAKPDDHKQLSALKIEDGDKESLLESLNAYIASEDLNIKTGVMVQQIEGSGDILTVKTEKESFKTRKVILAIGKSGNSRQLKVPGESLPKVFNRLFDPGEFHGKNILVVGGGDSALEASIALAQSGNHVTHSYRKSSFSRPKPENETAFNSLTTQGSIDLLLNSEVTSITSDSVHLKVNESVQTIPNDIVYTLIGRELPLSFFKRIGIRMDGQKDFAWYVFLVAMISFFTMVYFGKSGFAIDAFSEGSWTQKIQDYFIRPFTTQKSWMLPGYKWYASLNFYLGWAGSVIWLMSGSAALILMLKRHQKYFSGTWNIIKYCYLIFVAGFFTWVYFRYMLGQKSGWVYEPTYYYSLFYCITMALFGIRRALVRKTRYIKYQMAVLISIQVLFLFLLPYYLYDLWIVTSFSPDSYVIKQMFPDGKWSSFGFILFWPLNISNFGTSTFWTWFPFVQTFGILFLLVYQFGKGAYCGWICSCGGMAETLGDEYREKAPHGPSAKKWENLGQAVLVWITLATILHYSALHLGVGAGAITDTIWGLYKICIDVLFAGVLGLGVYFFLGGRIWCRYGCPLAALMHIYARFSVYRIFSEKKKCISCNMCTKVCHMGIDVMSFASRGIPMNDVECVRCSACVQSCPTEVLSFGELFKSDTHNTCRPATPPIAPSSWKAGIR